MPSYYYRQSYGAETNLQLYSLKQALLAWDKIEHDYSRHKDNAPDLRERCVFALSTLGLSISQLLGQNNPNPSDKVPYPAKLLKDFVHKHQLNPDLLVKFDRFSYFYNGCRHFGRTRDDSGYSRVDQLTYHVAKESFEFGLDLWNEIVGVFDGQPGADLGEFDARKVDREC